MASEREAAKQAASEPESTDPELGEALNSASRYHLELAKESNRHKEKMAAGERGALGRLLGGSANAPTTIAFIATLAGLLIAGACFYQASTLEEGAELWGNYAERAFAFSGMALGFIFGRGLK